VASEAEAIPFPREDTTPPVTNTNLVISARFAEVELSQNGMKRYQMAGNFTTALFLRHS
jgi:hypothetical protein